MYDIEEKFNVVHVLGQFIDDSIKEYQEINRQIAELNHKKEELAENLIKFFKHEHEGQRQYKHKQWKVEIRTPSIYSLDKKLYESRVRLNIPKEFNPVKESISYTIDKNLCEEYLLNAPEEVKDILIKLIDKKPGKPSVTIKENV